jgi:hypothetical protein
MNTNAEHWAYEELRKRLSEKTQTWVPPQQDPSEPQVRRITTFVDHDLGTVFLMHPRARAKINEGLFETIYPHIVRTLDGEPLEIPTIDEIRQIVSDARHELEASRVVTFLMTDPARPVGTSERPLWFFRFTLKVRLFRYILSSECVISIPFPAAGTWLLDLLADARIRETATHVSADSNEFQFSISSDASNSYEQDDEWKAALATNFTGHVRIAEYVDQFEQDPFNYLRRSQMIETVAATYGKAARPIE